MNSFLRVIIIHLLFTVISTFVSCEESPNDSNKFVNFYLENKEDFLNIFKNFESQSKYKSISKSINPI